MESTFLSNSRQVGFRPGLHRPSGTLVEEAGTATAAAAAASSHFRAARRSLKDGPVAERMSEAAVAAQMDLAEAELAAGDVLTADRRLKALEDARLTLRPLLTARLLFALGNVSSALSRLPAADAYLEQCASTLQAAVGSADPTLVPALLNRGLVLTRSRQYTSAVRTLRRARCVCDGLLGVPRLALLRSRVLHALATALEGSGKLEEAEAAYRDALGAAEEDERMGERSRKRRPQPSRAALAALLQARGDHAGALALLDVQRAAWRDAKAETDDSSCYSSSEHAHVAGRAAVAAFAVHRQQHAIAALKEALAVGPGGSSVGEPAARALELANEVRQSQSQSRTTSVV